MKKLTVLLASIFFLLFVGLSASYAEHKKNPKAGHGGGGSGGDDATYSVFITGDVGGNSLEASPWSSGGGKKTISGRQHNAGVLTDLSFFTALVNGPFTAIQGSACFGAYPFQLFGGTIKPGKKGTAQASFWFEANTYTEPAQTLFYLLHYTGVFNEGEVWLPEFGSPADLTMTHWKLSATNEGEDIKAISCIGEGTTNVFIEVTNTTAP